MLKERNTTPRLPPTKSSRNEQTQTIPNGALRVAHTFQVYMHPRPSRLPLGPLPAVRRKYFKRCQEQSPLGGSPSQRGGISARFFRVSTHFHSIGGKCVDLNGRQLNETQRKSLLGHQRHSPCACAPLNGLELQLLPLEDPWIVLLSGCTPMQLVQKHLPNFSDIRLTKKRKKTTVRLSASMGQF